MSSIPLMRAQRNLLADIANAAGAIAVDQLTHADGPKSLSASLAFLVRKGQIEDVTTADADVKSVQITADGKLSVKEHDSKIADWMAAAELAGIPVEKNEETMKDIADKCSAEKPAVKRLKKLAIATGWVAPVEEKAEEAATVPAGGVSEDEGEVADQPRARKVG